MKLLSEKLKLTIFKTNYKNTSMQKLIKSIHDYLFYLINKKTEYLIKKLAEKNGLNSICLKKIKKLKKYPSSNCFHISVILIWKYT